MSPAESAFWVALVKPFLAFLFFGIAYVLARGLLALIPDGRVKRLLTRPIGFKSRNPRRYRDWQ